jgi:hypothetical protein
METCIRQDDHLAVKIGQAAAAKADHGHGQGHHPRPRSGPIGSR